MTTQEKLEQIKVKCEELIALHSQFNQAGIASTSQAGWRSTISAIDFLVDADFCDSYIGYSIVAAWGDLL
jgi:hypothetical protein